MLPRGIHITRQPVTVLRVHLHWTGVLQGVCSLGSACAPRAQVMDFLGQAAFSKAVQAVDISSGRLVCLKIIKNNKDYFDQSLDEVKLLSLINAADPGDAQGLLRLYDYFYYKVPSLARLLAPCIVASAPVGAMHLWPCTVAFGHVSASYPWPRHAAPVCVGPPEHLHAWPVAHVPPESLLLGSLWAYGKSSLGAAKCQKPMWSGLASHNFHFWAMFAGSVKQGQGYSAMTPLSLRLRAGGSVLCPCICCAGAPIRNSMRVYWVLPAGCRSRHDTASPHAGAPVPGVRTAARQPV